MSPNTISSKETSSTYIGRTEVFNDISRNDKKLCERQMPEIIITKHLCEPCPGSYTDIFNKVLIICKDPSHKKPYKKRVE